MGLGYTYKLLHMKVLIFSAIQDNGGIQQFSIQVLRTCLDLGWETYSFIPDYKNIEIPNDLRSKIIRYRKQKDILGIMPQMFKVAHQINKINPDYMFITDDCMYSVQVMRWVKPSIKKIFTVHDVTFHPGRKENILRKLLNFISAQYYRREGFFHSKYVLVLSENSKKRFEIKYPYFNNKVKVMNLGAHPPKCDTPKKPEEIGETYNYILYFGRIEKYKGIINAIKAYKKAGISHTKLVIAGNGKFTDEEIEELKDANDIVIIKRYILDAEMVWLMQNTLVLVAPYFEASQSGVLPIAYHYGKPVVVSNIDGLREMVSDGETGFVYNDVNHLTSIMKTFSEKGMQYSKSFIDACLRFEEEKLNWSVNISNLFA